jgi:hypothetical protein
MASQFQLYRPKNLGLLDFCINLRFLKSSAERFEPSKEMQQLVSQLFVAIHGQDKFAGGTNNASSALNEGPTSVSVSQKHQSAARLAVVPRARGAT